MGGIKVKIKFKSNNICNQKDVLILLKSLGIKISGIFVKPMEMIILCVDIYEAEKIFSEVNLNHFGRANLSPLLPAELKTSRFVITNYVNKEILQNEQSEIKIETCNPWCKVLKVIKFRNNRGMKIVFSDSTMASKCLEIGLSIFYLHIPSYDIKKDYFYNILICYACYALDSHMSSKCPKKETNPDYRICSNCSDTSHDYRNCPNEQSSFKCINCNGSEKNLINCKNIET